MTFTRRLVLVIFPLTVVLNTYGQERNTNLNQQDIRNLDANFMAPSFNVAYEGTYGTPFLNKDWVKGVVIMTNGDTLQEQDLKYDIYQDQLILKDKRSGQAIIPMEGVVQSFVVEDSSHVEHIFINFSINKKEDASWGTGFYEILYQGNSSLLAKHRKVLIEADYEGAYSANRPYDEFKTDKKQYALIKENNSFIQLNRGKRGVLKSLNDDGTLERIVKEKKLDLKNEENLIDLIIVIDSM